MKKNNKTEKKPIEKKKNITKLITNLDERQKKALANVLMILQNGEKLKKQDIGLLGYDLNSVPHSYCAKLFKVSDRTLFMWVDKGCPKNKENSTYDLYEVTNWLVNKERKKHETGGTLKDKKTNIEIERIRAQIQKIRQETMPREEHEAIIKSWASSFKNFFPQAVRKNIHHFEMQKIDSLNVLFHEFGKQLMEIWSI